MAYGMEVSVKLELVMFKLRLPLWIQVILATQVHERTRLSEGDVLAIDLERERGS